MSTTEATRKGFYLSENGEWIPDGWNETNLYNLSENMYSGGTPPTKTPEYYGGGIPWVRTQEVHFNFIKNTDIHITQSGFENSATKWVPENSVIIAMYGNSAARSAYLKIPATTNQACCNFVPDPKKSDPRFIFYNVLSRYSEIESKANGAAQQNLNVGVLKELTIKAPIVDEQKAIADVLWSLDEKIELLREQNETLESLAQTLFNRWFADFNFPDENGNPYKDSGGAMISSEIGEIPDRWKVDTFEKYTSVSGGGTPSTKESVFWDGEFAWSSPKDLSDRTDAFLFKTNKTITAEGLKAISSGLNPAGSLLLSSRAPIGYIAISDIPVAVNQGYIVFAPEQYLSNQFMYLWLKKYMNVIINAANGSTFLEISKKAFKEIEAIIPEESTLDAFQILVKPQFKKLRTNLKQIENLTQLRNMLLPKLMKGEIRVPIES